MGVVYAGSTPKYLIKIKDKNGNQLDPSDAQQVSEVKVFIYNDINGTIFARLYLNTLPSEEGWTQMTTKEIEEDDIRILMVLTASHTNAAEGNSNVIQVDTHIPDAEVPGGTRVVIKKGKFSEIKPAKTQ